MRPISMLFFSSLSLSIYATEVDNFTHRSQPLKDIQFEINQLVNKYFDETIEIANQKNHAMKKLFCLLSPNA